MLLLRITVSVYIARMPGAACKSLSDFTGLLSHRFLELAQLQANQVSDESSVMQYQVSG